MMIKNWKNMEIETMYNNLFNSNEFQTLLTAYRDGNYANLSSYLEKYVSKKGGKNKTKKNKPKHKNETRRIKVKSNRKTRRRSNNKSKKQK